MNKLIEVRNVSFSYGIDKRKILRDVNLDIFKGKVIGLVGLSGCGKSTLLYILSGIIPHIYSGQLEGEVKLFGENIKNMKISEITKKIGIVFQDPETQLFSPTVEDEIAFGPENLCVPRDEIGIRIDKALKIVNMEEYRFENPNNLSGGQKQLIAIASVLSMEPEILLFDEIVSQLDNRGKENIKNVLMDLKSENRTLILIEHDYNNLKVADRIMELKDGKLHEIKK